MLPEPEILGEPSGARVVTEEVPSAFLLTEPEFPAEWGARAHALHASQIALVREKQPRGARLSLAACALPTIPGRSFLGIGVRVHACTETALACQGFGRCCSFICSVKGARPFSIPCRLHARLACRIASAAACLLLPFRWCVSAEYMWGLRPKSRDTRDWFLWCAVDRSLVLLACVCLREMGECARGLVLPAPRTLSSSDWLGARDRWRYRQLCFMRFGEAAFGPGESAFVGM